MNPEQAVRQLKALKNRRLDTAKAVRRKKAISPSERAAWLTDLDFDVQALDLAIETLSASDQKAA